MRDIRQKRILVTGGTGFLGTHLVEELLRHGVPMESIFVPRSKEYDLRKNEDVERLFKASRPEIVFHLANVSGGITMLQEQPARIYHDNLVMHTAVADTAQRHSVEKFIAVGTALMYPKDASMPLKESELWNGYPSDVTACYGLPNRMLVAQLQMYRKQYGFNGISVILCNLYGPGDHFFTEYPHVIPAMIRKFCEQEEVTLFGTGEAAREFLYITDAARALIAAAEQYDGEAPLNVGSGIATPLREIAQAIQAITGFTGNISWDASKPEGERIRHLDLTRSRQELGFAASTTLEEGLKMTVDWYRQHRR